MAKDSRVNTGIVLGIFIFLSISLVVAQETEATFVDPGMTPDNIFYAFERFFEDIQLVFIGDQEEKLHLEAELSAERLAEINAMIQQENYQAAMEAAEEANEILNDAETHVAEFGTDETIDYNLFLNGETALNDLLIVHDLFIEDSEHVKSIKDTLLVNVEEGSLDEETAALIINDVQEGIASVETAIVEQKEELIETTAETNNVPELEVEIAVEKEEEELGISEVIKNEVTEEEILTLETAILELEDEIAQAEEEGQIEGASAD
ncbi:MAG: DUF5667 domain-containing protein, partial [Nanoarchaeota archaeon]